MNPQDLADSGSRLASLDVSKRPREADLRRAVTSSYSACVHALCLTVANLMIGATRAARDTEAWFQAYKAMEHGRAKAISSDAATAGIKRRVRADYLGTEGALPTISPMCARRIAGSNSSLSGRARIPSEERKGAYRLSFRRIASDRSGIV